MHLRTRTMRIRLKESGPTGLFKSLTSPLNIGHSMSYRETQALLVNVVRVAALWCYGHEIPSNSWRVVSHWGSPCFEGDNPPLVCKDQATMAHMRLLSEDDGKNMELSIVLHSSMGESFSPRKCCTYCSMVHHIQWLVIFFSCYMLVAFCPLWPQF